MKKKIDWPLIFMIILAAIIFASCAPAVRMTEANSPKPVLKGKKHILVPGNAYRIKKKKI